MAKSNHNKYVSYPDWFGSSTSQPTQQQQVTQTIYYGSGGSSSSSGGAGLTGVVTQGSGNAVTSGMLDGTTLVLNKDLTFVTDQSSTNTFWELREDLNGKQYLYANYDIATLGGHTMYVDGDDTLNLPELYDGIPIDNITIYWDTDKNGNKVLKSAGTGSGGGGVADKIAWANVYGKPSWVTDYKPIYDYSEIQNVPDLSGFVTIEKYQEIKGVKNFLNGIQIADLPITKLNGYEDVIYIDANVVVRGGVTMYYQYGEVDLPSIIDEIGIAGYDGKKLGLVSFSSSQFSIDANGNVTIKGGSTGLDTAQLKDYLDSNKYTTETWVKEQDYASASSLSSLQTKVNNFLEGSDTDTIINKWKELEVFLSGLSESDNLATILATKWTTDNSLINNWNTAYGWGNHASAGYALKSYVDDTFVTVTDIYQSIEGVKNFINGLEIGGMKLSKSQEGVVYLDGNLVVKGGVTMYALDEITVDSIIDSIPLASTSQYGIAKFNPSNFVINEDGFVTIIGGSGTTVKYPLSWSGFNQGSYDGSVAQSFYIPTKLSEFVNDKSFATTSDLSGYLPLSGGKLSTNTSSIVLTLNASSMGDQNYLQFYNSYYSLGCLGFSAKDNPVYRTSSGANYKLWHSGNFTPSDYLLASNYTASDILAKLLTVDGSGSGLDADLLDGLQPSELNVGSATKLQTARTIWGQPFDGTGDITGHLQLAYGSAICTTDSNNTSLQTFYLNQSNQFHIGQQTSSKGYSTYLYGNSIIFGYSPSLKEGMRLTSAGNVLIGITTDSGHKLDVNGTIYTSSNVDIPLGTGDIGITAGGKSILRATTSGVIISPHISGTGGIYFRPNGNADSTYNAILDTSGCFLVPSLNVNGIPIYKSQNNVLYIDGNLVVRGGVTMYAENEVDIPSIIDSLPIASTTSLGVAKFDSNFFSVGSDGKVTFIGSVGTTVENATYTTKGIASFNSASFTINDGAVDLKTKIVITSSTPSSFNNNTLYIIT